MSNNFQAKDAAGSTLTLKSTDNGGVHTPHHNVDSLPADPFGAIADAAITSDTTGSISGKLRGLVAWAYAKMPASLGQKVKTGSLPVVLASDQDAIGITALPAGEAIIGVTGETLAKITVTPSINPAAYASADVIGALNTVASFTRVSAGSGRIVSAVLIDKANQAVAVDVILFNANPSASTFTDNAAITVNAADLAKILGVLHFDTPDYFAFAANAAAPKQYDLGFVLPSGSTVYAVFVSRGTPTYASASDLILTLTVRQN